MLLDTQSFVAADFAEFDDGDYGSGVETRDFRDLVLAPAANQAVSSWTVVRRGCQLMVVFSGCPCPSVAASLRDAGVQIGLALMPGELNKVTKLDYYNYTFISIARNPGQAQKQAVADLASNGWVVDESSLWAPEFAERDKLAAIARCAMPTKVPA